MVRLLFLILLVGATVTDSSREKQWNDFKKTFRKNYTTSIEDRLRRIIWGNNVMTIQHHNLEADLGMHSFYLGLNEYSDSSEDGFFNNMNGYRLCLRREDDAGSFFIPPSNVLIPDAVDWRKDGLVTPVKNQRYCGSCWAFSTTGSLEGQHKRKTGTLVSLSEQNLLDCSADEGNMGCDGGLMDLAFEYIRQNKGIDTEASYPYTAEERDCKFNTTSIGATCTGYVDIPTGDEEALKKAVATVGPISAAIDADNTSFMFYRSGVYDEPACSSTRLNHGVLVVGYGTEEGKDYWLVKNSWGPSWGVDGYIKMSRNKNNQCGIATRAVYPLV